MVGDEDGVEQPHEDAQTMAQRMVEGRVIAKTTDIYKKKLRQMLLYFQENFPDMLDVNDDFILPMDADNVLSFLGHICQHAGGGLKSKSTVGSYRSAIVWHYKGKHMRLDATLDTKLSNFTSGFKRAIADAKQKVILRI